MDFERVMTLKMDMFLLMRKNNIVNKLKETKEGQEYLEKCERLTKTVPESGIAEKFKNAKREVRKNG